MNTLQKVTSHDLHKNLKQSKKDMHKEMKKIKSLNMEISKLLKEGVSRREVYDRFQNQFEDKALLSATIGDYPEPSLARNYRTLIIANYCLTLSAIATFVLISFEFSIFLLIALIQFFMLFHIGFGLHRACFSNLFLTIGYLVMILNIKLYHTGRYHEKKGAYIILCSTLLILNVFFLFKFHQPLNFFKRHWDKVNQKPLF